MKDDFANFLENFSKKADKAMKAAGKVKKTVIVHPAVWKDEKEAKKASSDWKYREFTTAQRELEKAAKGR
jgi:hypothetical protein